MAEKYVLRVTAGTDYDLSTHKLVPVNSETPISLESDLCTVTLNVRVQGYNGLPLKSSSSSPYFSLPLHVKNRDTYSIGFSITPKDNISGADLVFGNDFDHSLKERLPPGSNLMLKAVKSLVDPGLEGDLYADRPYLYGPLGSSINKLWIGKQLEMGEDGEGMLVEEGGDRGGMELRKQSDVPEDEAGRRKWFLQKENRSAWVWPAGQSIGCDFFNGMLDFNKFAIRIPSPSTALPDYYVSIMKYWDGQPARNAEEQAKRPKRSHTLRYVCKNKATDEVLFCVLFTLYLKDDVDAQGNVKPGVEGGMPFDKMTDSGRAEKLKRTASEAGEDKENTAVERKMVDVDDDDVD